MTSAIICVLAFLLAIAVILFYPQTHSRKKRRYSILIACRNEAANIAELIANLNIINYPQDKYQVLIVDDASEDNTWKLLQEHTASCENIKIFSLPEKSTEYLGKKAALKTAAENADFEYLLYTDADCRLQPDILHSYNDILSDNTDAAIGWYHTRNASSLQKIIDLSTAFIFAVTTRLKIPFSASGMNWLLRKKMYYKCGGYENIKHHIAGDDKHLLLQAKKKNAAIRFNFLCPVDTVLPAGESQQRLARKYGKFSSSPFIIKFFTLILIAFYLLLPVYTVLSGAEFLLIYLSTLYLLWMIVLLRFRVKFQFYDIIYLIIIPYMIIFFTVKGIFFGWNWKGQKQKGVR